MKRIISLKELAERTAGLASGHRACAGCSFPSIIRMVLGSSDYPVVVSNATGCLEVVSTIYPYSSWPCSWIHVAFENAAAVISGVESAYKALKRRGEIPQDKKIVFIAIGGDGGTYDIGLQALSGALERGHDFLYLLYDNQAYMNTGIQRSSATPFGASTTTSPAGKYLFGKVQDRKEIIEIVAAHRIPYVAQASISHWGDLIKKLRKAYEIEGPKFLSVIAPCVIGWGYKESETVEIARLAVETCFWPLYEIEKGVYRVNYKPKEKLPVKAWLLKQERFSHLNGREDLIEEIQKRVDEKWEKLLRLDGLKVF
ncbi:MAG: thiamine pyrophosphate-dependent enzyme [Candidatus Hydrothermales bacterium]